MAAHGRVQMVEDAIKMLIDEVALTNIKALTADHIVYMHRAPSALGSIDLKDKNIGIRVGLCDGAGAIEFLTIGTHQNFMQNLFFIIAVWGDKPTVDSKLAITVSEEVEEVFVNAKSLTNGGQLLRDFEPVYAPFSVPGSEFGGGAEGIMHFVYLELTFHKVGTLAVP